MSDCSNVRSWLALGDDMEPSRREAVREHVAACRACRLEEEKFLGVMSWARRAVRRDLALPSSVRFRIAAQAAERARRSRWTAWLPTPGFVAGKGALAAMTACLVALLALPLLRTKAPAGQGADVSPNIDVVSLGGAVRVVWTDGTRGSYTVEKSADPRFLAGGETHVVQTRVWVDMDPETSPVVFYRIE